MKVIFTDLDGTLLDHSTYSFKAAESSLEYVKNHDVPVIFCTSKTRSEIEYWRLKIDNNHPFISENGGGIYIPKNYFSFALEHAESTNSLKRIQLGSSFTVLEKTMKDLEQKFDITSFISMNTERIMKLCGLSKNQALLASKREFDIPFILNKETDIKEIEKIVTKQNLHITKGGRFYHLIGDNDKGKAVKFLISLFQKQFDSIETIGIGDSENDFSMLHIVDKPYLVRKKDYTFASSSYPHVHGIGPIGWQQIIELEIIKKNVKSFDESDKNKKFFQKSS